MTLSEELRWRGFFHQTTYKDIAILDDKKVRFYFGVDPSADSMTIGNLAAAMLVKCLMKHGHEAVLLVGGATGLIGDPDGKSEERQLKTDEEIERNTEAIARQYRQIFGAQEFKLVNNRDWFKDYRYLDFLRDVGKHVPMRQMLARDFVETRLGETGSGISYAEFSYVLIQAYDFLHLYEQEEVTLQVCGSDQWGNSIAGVDLIRRKTGGEAHVYSVPLIVNKATGKKFGKSEGGAIWLDPAKTTPTQFFQFWMNVDDEGVEDYLKIFTELSREEIDEIIGKHRQAPEERYGQQCLALEVTKLVHGHEQMQIAQTITEILINPAAGLSGATRVMDDLRREVPSTRSTVAGSLIEAAVQTGLAASNSEARRLLQANAFAINGKKVQRENFEAGDFVDGRLLLRRGKAYKDSALIEAE